MKTVAELKESRKLKEEKYTFESILKSLPRPNVHIPTKRFEMRLSNDGVLSSVLVDIL